MCNLFANTMPVEAMRRLFDVDPAQDALGNAEPQPAIFPRGDAVIVRRRDEGAREALRAHWGFLMPQVSKRTGQPILPKAVNNARDDKLRDSPFWRESFRTRRCLMPATSYCEAQGRNPATYHWFALAGDDLEDRPPFAFAALWRSFRGRYRDALVEIDTCTMVTTTPNDLTRPIHPDRMPVILAPQDYATWLEGDADDAFALARPFPADAMRIVASGLDLRRDGPVETPAPPAQGSLL